MRILVAEDDRDINRLVCEFLGENGWEGVPAENGQEALRLLRAGGFSLVLLDLMLPLMSGDMVLQRLREFSDVPVIVVSAKSMTQARIDALNAGADDYVTKPFDLDELLARIEAVLRRTGAGVRTERKLRYKGLVLDRESGTASVYGQPLSLTAKEYAILELMLSNPAKLFSRANLFESVWNEPYFGEDSTVKVHMSNIRGKLRQLDPEETYIENVWGMGYKLG